jgi:hypothetical protein
VPSDKSFSVPTFLSLVHGKTEFNELERGLSQLRDQLHQQSRRRENLVRTHFGLFVQCAEGLQWLKQFRQSRSTCCECCFELVSLNSVFLSLSLSLSLKTPKLSHQKKTNKQTKDNMNNMNEQSCLNTSKLTILQFMFEFNFRASTL